jgi:hypothetical protein
MPIDGLPLVHVYVGSVGRTIGLRTPLNPGVEVPASPLAQISVSSVMWRGSPHLQVETSSTNLFREFYSFLLALSDRIQLEAAAPLAALQLSLDSWRSLLSSVVVLSEEEQLGLFGELWVLERLLARGAAVALRAWVGPTGAIHDFRIEGTELEIKVTRLESRIHHINGLQQLTPSPNLRLFIVSLQLVDAGAGQGVSLPELIQRIDGRLGDDAHRALFTERLSAAGYAHQDAPHYPIRRRQRSSARLIPVDRECPRITQDLLDNELAALVARISQVAYATNLEALGVDEESGGFQALLPKVPIS